MEQDRITIDPKVMGGVPCIRGMRYPVTRLVHLIADGMTYEQFVQEHPDSEHEDIRRALAFAAEAVNTVDLPVDHS